jgi:quinol monooxygenase YgiN
MIVVVGRVQTDADRRDALVRIGQAVSEASREETGCISYRLYQDTELDNAFVFVAPPDVKFHTIASTMDLAELSADQA